MAMAVHRSCCGLLVFAALVVTQTAALTISDVKVYEDLLRQSRPKPGCPLCDSSVYSYCNDKLLHDACCCLDAYETHLPAQCHLADCSFLHSNTCYEHRLITRCCCDRLIYIKK